MKAINIHGRKISSKYMVAFVCTLVFCLGIYMKASGSFSPGPLSTFNRSGVELEGYVSHADFQTECAHCHAPIHCLSETRCQDCHKEVAQQRSESSGLHGLLPGTNRCQNCHPEHRGQEPLTTWAFMNVDHAALTGFSLALHQEDYAGEPMNCHSCHTLDHFGQDTLDCATCHMQENAEAMADHIELYGMTCAPCHDGQDRMEAFEHENFYVLEGGHAEADCSDCHADHVFQVQARDCIDCHADPEIHLGQFGLDCSRCHTDQAWTPAVLTRHTFDLHHGGGEQPECEVCHTTTLAVYNCYGCHDHEPEAMESLHLEEGIIDLEPCATCHPTGAPGEGSSYMELQRQLQNSSKPGLSPAAPQQEFPLGLVP